MWGGENQIKNIKIHSLVWVGGGVAGERRDLLRSLLWHTIPSVFKLSSRSPAAGPGLLTLCSFPARR